TVWNRKPSRLDGAIRPKRHNEAIRHKTAGRKQTRRIRENTSQGESGRQGTIEGHGHIKIRRRGRARSQTSRLAAAGGHRDIYRRRRGRSVAGRVGGDRL